MWWSRQRGRRDQEERTPTMAQFLLSVWHDDHYEVDFDSEAMQRIGPKVMAWNNAAIEAGVFVFAGGLMPAASATVVRADESGTVSMTDGPYAETKEMMGGFWVIDVPDLDAALDWASRGAQACEQPVEVRPFQAGG
jgi:hypothetical protein